MIYTYTATKTATNSATKINNIQTTQQEPFKKLQKHKQQRKMDSQEYASNSRLS